MGLGKDLPLWLSLLFQCINFAVLAGALVYFLRKPYKEYLQKRHQTAKEKIEEAERLLKEAAESKVAYERKIAGLDAEIAGFRAMVGEEMEKERTRILEEARALASRIREQARLAYDQEMKDAMMKVRLEIAESTTKQAEERVRQSFRKEDHDRMVEEFIEKVRSIN